MHPADGGGFVPAVIERINRRHPRILFHVVQADFDPMYGPAVRCKGFFVDLGDTGLASMYPASRWSIAPGHHGYQRACDLFTG